MKFLYPFVFFMLLTLWSFAQPGDTTVVQTYTFEAQNNPLTDYDSPGRRWFEFPAADNGLEYQKILMLHTLKCFEEGTAGGLGYDCGEWDYLSYNHLYKHTGIWDSLAAIHPRYLINQTPFVESGVVYSAIEDILFYTQQTLQINELVDESGYLVGADELISDGPFASVRTMRAQYLYTAEELIASGLTAGPIHRLGLELMQTTELYENFSVQLRSTAATEHVEFTAGGWTLVYNQHINGISGENIFNFLTPFEWDGTSSILVECAYDLHVAEFSDNTAITDPAPRAVRSLANDRYIRFDGNDQVVVPPSAFDAITDQVTIMCWVYGTPEFQPEDGTCFEGVNANNQRVLNVHLPWSNGRVYWDAGQSGGFDRIDKLAATANYEGQWNHWAFVKNSTTGVMTIYLNGVQWHTGTNRFRTMEDITKFTLGSAAGWSNSYRGSVDEFSVWNAALPAATIQEWMKYSIPSDHPFIDNLQVYYTFDEETGPVIDHSGNERHGWMLGNAQRIRMKGRDLFLNQFATTTRPRFTFYRGSYSSENITQQVSTNVPQPAVSLAEYAVNGNSIELVNVEYVYLPSNASVIGVDGEIISSIFIDADEVIVNEDLAYYNPPFEILERYELGRYITPYGIQLDMGSGWTWVYDVTDFATLLRDSVELECGNWQELLDLKFLFIEGEPAREVKRIENAWTGNWGLSGFNDVVQPLTFTTQAGEVGVKLRTTLTGHGFGNNANNCGEFCYNTHNLAVNGSAQWNWQIMQECDQNPLFPQGGTWIYGRAGWCPGMEGRTEEFELTPFLSNGQVTAEYGIQTDPFGNYVTESQVVYYGPINHSVDVGVEQILAPSDFLLNSRFNPMCDNPRFVLINKGSTPLSEVTIQYRVSGGTVESFTWTGNLGFMESEEVELHYVQPIIWSGDDATPMRFYLDVVAVGDANLSNNHSESSFLRPVFYTYMEDENDEDDNRVIVILKTNLANQETSWTIFDINGNAVHSRSSFPQTNTIYRDTIALNAGCYTFHLFDAGGDGMSFFANNDGAGYCKLDRVSGSDFISFERDFGQDILHSFQFGTELVSVTEMMTEDLLVSVYPNPANHSFTIKPGGFDRGFEIRVTNVSGQLVHTQSVQSNTPGEGIVVPCADWAPGMYQISVSDSHRQASSRLIRN